MTKCQSQHMIRVFIISLLLFLAGTTYVYAGSKVIDVDLSEQRLRYFSGEQLVGSFLISSGIKKMPTPVGTFKVRKKLPLVLYKGPGYYFPNTKWNLQFLPGYYIHGAYWHNAFGTPRSHGCVNVSYKNMEPLYTFADLDTTVIIHQ